MASRDDDDDDEQALYRDGAGGERDAEEDGREEGEEEGEEGQEGEEEAAGGAGGAGGVDIPFKCTSSTGRAVDVPDNVRSAIRTIVEVKPELDAITKACGQVRKKVTAAKKEVEKFMTQNQVDVVAFGASKYLRVHKERVKVDLKSIKNSQVLTEKQKQKLIAENTKPAVSFKQE
jgi:hypothetical protein